MRKMLAFFMATAFALASTAYAQSATQDTALKIVVIEGEDAVNIAIQISATATFQGQTAIATIAQSNVLTAAEAAGTAAGAGGGAGGGTGTSTGAVAGGGFTGTVSGGSVSGALTYNAVTDYRGDGFSGRGTWTGNIPLNLR